VLADIWTVSIFIYDVDKYKLFENTVFAPCSSWSSEAFEAFSMNSDLRTN